MKIDISSVPYAFVPEEIRETGKGEGGGGGRTSVYPSLCVQASFLLIGLADLTLPTP